MEEATVESQVEPPILGIPSCKRRKGGESGRTAKEGRAQGMESKGKVEAPKACEERSTDVEEDYNDFGIRVSPFDYSVENHLRAMDRISKLYGEDAEEVELDQSEVKRLSSSVTFLREWRLFNYEPRDVRFSCELESSEGKKVAGGINLHQFSSATVCKKEGLDSSSPELRDFVMYAGGPVWGLDWCPIVRESPNSQLKCEFIAIAAHPPGSSYHKIGAPLSGRGLIQIWSVLNISGNEGDIPSVEKPKRGYKKSAFVNEKASEEKRPRGRPRKKPIKNGITKFDGNNRSIKPFDTEVPKSSSNFLAMEGIPGDVQDSVLETAFVKEKPGEVKRPRGRPRKKPLKDDIIELDGNVRSIESFVTQDPENSSNLLAMEGVPWDTQHDSVLETAFPKENPGEVKKHRGRPREKQITDDISELDGDNRSVEPFVIQDPENSSNWLAIEGVPSDTRQDSGLEATFLKEKPSEVKKRRGRPRKKSITDEILELDGDNRSIEPFGIQDPENSSDFHAMEDSPRNAQEDFVLPVDRENCYTLADSACNLTCKTATQTRNLKTKDGLGNPVDKENCHMLADSACHPLSETTTRTQNLKNKDGEENCCNDMNQPPLDEHDRSILSRQIPGTSVDDLGISGSVLNNCDLEIGSITCPIPNDVALPRVVLCLAHNGKVAWDVKWRPNEHDSKCKHRMGFLAAVLGDGSLQVWEVPLPHTIKALYSSLHGEETDPRFVKLEPVFRCSVLKSGGVQSIPLTVEWSASPPHEFLLAGCHDGTVALWKFSADISSKDTRPSLRFTADTVPIRGVAWAPAESDTESANVILTAGHGGLKFWDIRDPFRPLWDLHPAPRNIYSLDWLPDPRCVVLSFDDGTMKTLSLSKAAYDVPVTGKPFAGTKQQGLHSYYYSSYAIWSIHVSRPTGMVAYCGADGIALRFQLTTKAVDKDASRNRAPVFLCGSLTMEESTITINTPTTNTPVPLKKSLNKGGDYPLALRDVLSVSNQAKKTDDKTQRHPASNDETLAFSYGNEPEVESEPEETIASLKRKKPENPGSSTKKKPEENLELVAEDDEARNTHEKEMEKVGKFEILPSKEIAMHRVRWNMNKGSERWLCYGGAAGIVRCQEIVLSDIDKKWAMKR